ncbi:hypothetical protein D3OALGA1CA_5067 [Olavius algarvensis associated proteobacterium Delta 3]|nr:hypothetical protein D3OALGA1CA_5067 [Olavius algarvensis associated proteobacterium Delta 3]
MAKYRYTLNFRTQANTIGDLVRTTREVTAQIYAGSVYRMTKTKSEGTL